MINPSADESLPPANSSGVGRGTAVKIQGPTFKKQQPHDGKPPQISARGGGGGGGGGAQSSWHCRGERCGEGIWGARLPLPLCTPFPRPCWLGSPSLHPGAPLGAAHGGGYCATTRPVLIPLPAPGVSTLFPPHSFSSFTFGAESPFSSLLLPPRLSRAAFPPACSPHLLPWGGGRHTEPPGTPVLITVPKGGESTRDAGARQRRQRPWTGMVTVALAPRRGRLGTRGPPGHPWPPGTPVRRSLAAEGGVWPRALARRLPNRGALWDAQQPPSTPQLCFVLKNNHHHHPHPPPGREGKRFLPFASGYSPRRRCSPGVRSIPWDGDSRVKASKL